MIKISLYFNIVTLMMFLWVSCAPSSSTPASSGAGEAASTASFPLTIMDDLEREVNVEAMPQRIVSLLPSNTEILFAVGAGDQVVGVTTYCNYPAEATTRQQVGGITDQSLSIETIVALEPDLVVASDGQNETISALEQAGLTVIVLNPVTFDDIYDNIELMGRVTGHADQAGQLIADMRRRIEAITTKVAAISGDQRPTIYYEVWHDPLMTAGPNTFIGQMIELAGGKNIFDDVNEDWPQVSAETIVERNPDIIIGPDSNVDELTVDKITTRPGWSNISAVQNDQIFLLDGDAISRSSPRIVDVLEEIARDLHPNLF